MIRGIVIGASDVSARFDSISERLRAELVVGIGRAALLVQTQTKSQKLSGQVLNVRTGRLRRSINVKITEGDQAVTATVGTNVKYAAVHEYGFDGTVSVREYLRRTKNGNTATVRAHDRHMHVPEKSFLRSALADMEGPIRLEFERAVQRAIA